MFCYKPAKWIRVEQDGLTLVKKINMSRRWIHTEFARYRVTPSKKMQESNNYRYVRIILDIFVGFYHLYPLVLIFFWELLHESFLKWEYPQIIHFNRDFHEINHPVIGDPRWKRPASWAPRISACDKAERWTEALTLLAAVRKTALPVESGPSPRGKNGKLMCAMWIIMAINHYCGEYPY